ncbi:MAG: GNAT family N-acetyltransferase [Thermoleophilaceae bacterium]
MADARPEAAPDRDAIRRVLEQAFAPSGAEARLVDALRADADLVPELCLVAEEGGKVVGHIAYSRARLESGHEVLALAPMGVLPERQRDGIGSALVRESLERAAGTTFPLVVVLGHPEYYPRFGFEPGAAFGVVDPYGAPPEAWMAHRLPSYTPEARGMVTYAEAFSLVE